MKIKQLCDLLEIKDTDNETIEDKLTGKLALIIMRFNMGCWPTSSFMAAKGGRAHKELEYLKDKGLLYFHANRDNNKLLYKLTDQGIEAYKTYYNAFVKK